MCGCAALMVYNPATEKKELILINEAMEIALGKSVAAEAGKKQKPLNDAAALARVEKIGRRIAAVSDRASIKYEFYVLDDKELNAMSLPGGIIYVNKGLLDELTDDELAYVLGHEVGHVAAKHSVKKVQGAVAFQTLLTIAFNMIEDDEKKIAAQAAEGASVVYALIALGYSRGDEYFADRLGVKYAFKAGYEPPAALSALRKIKKAEKTWFKTPVYLRSHPYADDRVKALEQYIPFIS